MHSTVNDWCSFSKRWLGPRNFRLADEMVGLSFAFPPIEQVIDELRHDDEASVKSGLKGATLDMAARSAEEFRKIPMEKGMDQPFALAHFNLGRFDAPGRFLYGFGETVLRPWEDMLHVAGFTWDRCYPIVFISGKGSATNYHMDLSHVLAWQIYGTKRFCGLVDPDRWADKAARLAYKPGALFKPVDLREEDSLCYDMRPGEMLWNVLLTPHWVEAGDEPAMSLNISHGGLRYKGALSLNEVELLALQTSDPDTAPGPLDRRYR